MLDKFAKIKLSHFLLIFSLQITDTSSNFYLWRRAFHFKTLMALQSGHECVKLIFLSRYSLHMALRLFWECALA